ncbi:hemolysin family protein [Nigerium massiliense]|uniref:hemolysin family protein n=1 Tax=Nigerium massiliense TaxID=1522317 RepID=UPI0006931FC2|nr:hemolysin family protein [Nigerium massiliense]
MTQDNWIQLGVALLCVILAGLLTAVDAAVASFSKSRAENLVKEGAKGAPKLLQITQDPAPATNALMFVRVLLEVSAIVLVTAVVFQHLGLTPLGVTVAIASMLLVSFIALGVAPRTVGRQQADTVALRAAGPLTLLTTVFGPISKLMILIGNALTPGKGFSDGPFTSEAELREMVDIAEASDLIEAGERKMIHSVFELGDTIVKEVMVPRTEMVYIEAGKSLRQGLSLALRSGFSRIPVIGEDVDDVLGILYLKDVIRRSYDNPRSQSDENVESLMRKPTFCPDSKPVDALLREMQLTRSHVVIVIDEFGGTAGLATIEDILEEIVGEIVDEYDVEIAPVTELADGRFRVSSRLSLDDLGELFGLDVDDEDVETVLGLMAKELNKIPIPGSIVEWEGIELVAERASGRRHSIQTVLAGRIPEEGADPADAGVDATVELAAESAARAQASRTSGGATRA